MPVGPLQTWHVRRRKEGRQAENRTGHEKAVELDHMRGRGRGRGGPSGFRESSRGHTGQRGEDIFWTLGDKKRTNTVWNYKAHFKALAPGRVLCPFSHVAHLLFPALRMVLTSEARPLAAPHWELTPSQLAPWPDTWHKAPRKLIGMSLVY